jgi:hypothetical protein
MVALWPLIVIPPLPFSGVSVAIVLLLAAECCEAGYLYRQRRTLLEDRGLVPLGAKALQSKDGHK